MKLALAAILLSSALPAQAEHYYGGYTQRSCYETRRYEQYIPGDRYTPGRIHYGTERVEVPCNSYRSQYHRYRHNHYSSQNNDNNSCIEGSILGGIAGGGIGATLSRGDGRWWAIPLGIVTGSMVGCQIDGG